MSGLVIKREHTTYSFNGLGCCTACELDQTILRVSFLGVQPKRHLLLPSLTSYKAKCWEAGVDGKPSGDVIGIRGSHGYEWGVFNIWSQLSREGSLSFLSKATLPMEMSEEKGFLGLGWNFSLDGGRLVSFSSHGSTTIWSPRDLKFSLLTRQTTASHDRWPMGSFQERWEPLGCS